MLFLHLYMSMWLNNFTWDYKRGVKVKMRIEDRGISWSLYVELRGAKTGSKVYTKGRQVFAGCDDELWRKKKKIHGTEEQVYISQTKQTRWGSGSESYINLKLSIISFAMYHIKMFMLLISMWRDLKNTLIPRSIAKHHILMNVDSMGALHNHQYNRYKVMLISSSK